MDTYTETTPILKAQRTLWKRELKNCKRQRIRGFFGRLYLLVMSEASPIKVHQHDHPNKC